jgi:RNA polymerase sigma-70 factor (ECF subfamily)
MEAKSTRIGDRSNPGDGAQAEAGSAGASSIHVLVERYRGPLRRFFLKRSHSPDDADDLVQEAFSRMAMRGPSEDVQNQEAFLFQIASNLLRDKARRERTRREADETLRHDTAGKIEEISPERVYLAKERVLAVQNALNELPERTRTIFVLHRFEEFRYREISVRLGISVSLVEKHMMDAIRHLNHRLGRR